MSAASEECIVIGAGVVGAACAAALARRGWPVRVLWDPRRSTTAASGGHVLLQSKRPGPVLHLARRSLKLLAEFAAGREAALGYRQLGSLVLAREPEEVAALRSHAMALEAAGQPVAWLTGDEARFLEPEISPAVVAATFCLQDAQVDPAALAGAWLEDAAAHGAVLEPGGCVSGFIMADGAVRGVITGESRRPARAVVLAAGAWSGELAALAGVRLDLHPRRGLLLRADTKRTLSSRPLLSAAYLVRKFAADPRSVSFSFQQHPDGRCLLGGTREFAGFAEEAPAEARERVLSCAAAYLPAVSALDWNAATVGFRPWTPDGRPIVGPSRVPGLYLACGHEGDGVTLAAATAEQVAGTVAPNSTSTPIIVPGTEA